MFSRRTLILVEVLHRILVAVAIHLGRRPLVVENDILVNFLSFVGRDFRCREVLKSGGVVLLSFVFHQVVRDALSLLASFVDENVRRTLQYLEMWISGPGFI